MWWRWNLWWRWGQEPLPACSGGGAAFRVAYPGRPGDRRGVRHTLTATAGVCQGGNAGARLGSGRGVCPSVTLPRGVHRPGREKRGGRRSSVRVPGCGTWLWDLREPGFVRRTNPGLDGSGLSFPTGTGGGTGLLKRWGDRLGRPGPAGLRKSEAEWPEGGMARSHTHTCTRKINDGPREEAYEFC